MELKIFNEKIINTVYTMGDDDAKLDDQTSLKLFIDGEKNLTLRNILETKTYKLE